MKSPILENPGPTPQVLPGLLVGEQMKTPGTDEELKKTHRWRRHADNNPYAKQTREPIGPQQVLAQPRKHRVRRCSTLKVDP